jgi:S1-C subfamily serine protease
VIRLVAALAVSALIAGCGGHRPDPSVVRVEFEGATDAAETATGFVAGRDRVVTVAHVLAGDGRRLVVRDRDGTLRRARLLRKDARNDLALLSVPGIGRAAPALHSGTAGGAVRIFVIRRRRPVALDARVLRPIHATVRGPNSGPYSRRALELSAHVRLGDSGAPVVDRDGRITGVLFARLSSGAPTAYAVDASAVRPFTNR